MKRLSWLLLAVFCSALVRVQPVDLSLAGNEAPCGCAMPDCCPPPARAPLASTSVQPIQATELTAPREMPAARRPAVRFYAQFVERAISTITLPASASATPPVGTPLFKAHHSFRI